MNHNRIFCEVINEAYPAIILTKVDVLHGIQAKHLLKREQTLLKQDRVVTPLSFLCSPDKNSVTSTLVGKVSTKGRVVTIMESRTLLTIIGQQDLDNASERLRH